MSRREAIERAASDVSVEEREANVIEHTFELLTPIFGGAAVSRKPVDKDNPIRVSAIRGQLRFWWRAARGGQFATIDELRKREAELWGEGTEPGLVSLSLESKAASQKDENYYQQDARDNWRPVRKLEGLAYIGFALQPTRDEQRQGVRARPAVLVRGRHTLRAQLAASADGRDQAELQAALWAWSRFGGIGGRTRRGFGAVEALGDVEAPTELLKSSHIVDRPPPKGIPSLAPSAGAQVVSIGKGDARSRWVALADRYQQFRQGKNVGRNPPKPGKWAGRSRWPEPDFIRHGTARQNRGASDHQDRIVDVDKAPRAQFGMPIIFHFIENIDDLTLKPARHERYASPLILRPVGTSAEAHGIALVLGNRPDLDQLGVVFSQGRQDFPVDVNLTDAEAGRLKDLGADPDPLISFLRYVENKSH